MHFLYRAQNKSCATRGNCCLVVEMKSQIQTIESIIEILHGAHAEVEEAKEVVNVAAKRTATPVEAKNGQHALKNAAKSIAYAIIELKKHTI